MEILLQQKLEPEQVLKLKLARAESIVRSTKARARVGARARAGARTGARARY